MPQLLAPLRDGRADAVFGSRMMTTFGALRGGMPLYKYVGNRVLTAMQNALLRTRLSEFHSGYRAYSVPALRRIRFALNSNDFHFDTEIIIQLLNVEQRIVEVPIPTHYGDEICYVDGVRYAKDVMLTTFQRVAHGLGVFNQRRFEPASTTATEQPLRRQARLPEQPPVRARRRARGQPRARHRRRARPDGPGAGGRRAARSRSSTSSRRRTRPATSRSSSRTSTTRRSSTPASTTTC